MLEENIKDYIECVGLNPEHIYKGISHTNKAIRGKDTDKIVYEEYDKEGNFIRKFLITDSTGKHPPFKREVFISDIDE